MSGGVLATKAVEKPWGRDRLPAPFRGPAGQRVGEIWFEPPPALDHLLAKYLFTSEKLSVQVHPDDAHAPSGTRGKEECWLVLDAEPDARLAIGFDRELSAAELRAAALDGSVEELLTWHPVEAGDFFYLPAGTVHAIGAGLTIAELQQNSDTTYRLFDYGRPRDLHLDAALAVASRTPYTDTRRRKVDPRTSATLVEGPRFRLHHVAGEVDATVGGRPGEAVMLLPLAGSVTLPNGEVVEPGGCGWSPTLAQVELDPAGRVLIFSAAT